MVGVLINLWVSSICFRRADGGSSRHFDAIAVDRIDGNRADDDSSAAIETAVMAAARCCGWGQLCYPSEIINSLILAFLSMCVLESCVMSAACTWGLRGLFSSPSLPLSGSFTTMYLLSHTCTNSNTLCFLGTSTCACVLVVTSSPHHHRPSVIITGTSHFLSTITTSHHMTSYLRSIAPQTSIATIEIICPSWLKRHPPLCLRHSLM